MVTAMAFVLGLLVGSFLNVCIYRLPLEESIVAPRSRCPACSHVLGALDLVPVLSYLVLRGRCRHCDGRISPRYALVEILTGAIFVFVERAYLAAGDAQSAAAFLLFYCAMVVVTFIDIDHMLILDVVTFPGMAVSLGMALWGHIPLTGETAPARIVESLCGLALGGGILWLVQFLGWLWYRRQGLDAMGLGDVKLAAFTGAFLGPRVEAAALLLAVLTGGVASIFLLLARRKGRKEYMPFGPWLVIGAVAAPFAGHRVLALYGY